MGRSTKLTPDVQDKLCALLLSGVTIENAVVACGIHKSTFYEWLKLGEDATRKSIYSDFSDAITHAKAEALSLAETVAKSGLEPQDEHIQAVDEVTEIRLRTIQYLDDNGKVIIEKVPYEYKRLTKRTQKITRQPDPRYALEYLWRRDPAKWARIQKNENTGKDGQPMEHDVNLRWEDLIKRDKDS